MSGARDAAARLSAGLARAVGGLPGLAPDPSAWDDLEGALADALRLVVEAEAEAAGLRSLADQAEARRAAFAQAAGGIRAALLDAMLEAGAPRVVAGHHACHVSSGRPGVVVTDAAILPHRFLRRPPPVPDLDAIRRALEAGEAVAGAELRNARPHLAVRPLETTR